MTSLKIPSSEQATAHLQPEMWAKVNRLHIRKAISEFAHELLIFPQVLYTLEGWDYCCLETNIPCIKYNFRSRKLMLDHWYIDLNSIEKFENKIKVPLDSLNFIIEIREQLGIDSHVLPTYLEEISSTLYSSAYKYTCSRLSSSELAQAGFQQVEHSMIEGHPTFVANNGRIGFDAQEYFCFAPEVNTPISLVWLAGSKDFATFSSISDLSYQELLDQELDTSTRELFSSTLYSKGLDPDSYFFIPVHPWQWYNKLVHIFAADLATNKLVFIGCSEDKYLAQQSIRTFFNESRPERFYVKTALSILNMGFMRGLSPYYMATTPEINEWLYEVISKDHFLKQKGFNILREVATVGYRNHYYERAEVKDSPYKKMLAALWRENPLMLIKPGQKVITMAALLHVDQNGQALLPEIIKSSGLDIASWLRKYLNCYLSPLLHCFYNHDLVFMPHGENLILVLENNVPVGCFMKDLAEEVNLYNTDKDLPEKVKRIAVDFPDNIKSLAIFTDVFDCIFRYLSHILVEHTNFFETKFWQLVAECILEYQSGFPQLTEKFERYDLFEPEFKRSCLNRLQLSNNRQMIDLGDPAKNLKFVGTLINPIAAFKKKDNKETANRDFQNIDSNSFTEIPKRV